MGWRRTRREEKTTTKMTRGGRWNRGGGFVVRGRRRGSVGCHRVRHRVSRRATATTAVAGGGSAVGVGPVSSLTDRQLGGSKGASLHRCRRRLLASHPSSSTVVSSGRRRLCTMLLRAAFSRWRSAMSFCRLSKKNFLRRRQDAVALAPAVVLGLGLLPPTEEEGGCPPPLHIGWWGGGRQAQDGGNVHRAGSPRPRRPPLLPPPLSPPPLSLSALHSTPRQDCSTIVQVYDAAGGGGAPMENLRIPLVA
jgi:hypothetical protein